MPKRRKAPSPILSIGVDVGGSKILAGVVGEGGGLLGRAKVRTPFGSGPDAVTARIVEACRSALAAAGREASEVSCFGIAVPGPVDPEKGLLVRAPNLAVTDYAVVEAVGSALFPGAKGAVGNDVRLAALGEARLGAGRGAGTMAAVWVGTGLGGGIVTGGHVVLGRNHNAGEIGHLFLDWREASPRGGAGTLERIAAKVGITDWIRRKVRRGKKSSLAKAVLRKEGRLKGSELAAAVRAGDRLAVRAVDRSARAVGVAVANIFNVLAPDLFVLGGGVAIDLGEPYLRAVLSHARRLAFSTELGSLEIVPAALGDDAGVLGAALYSREAWERRV